MERKRQNPQPFNPVKGEVYENAGGGRYLCESDPNGVSFDAWMTNTTSGWHCLCRNIVRYEDGTIEWDRSIDGRFVPIDKDRQEDIFRATVIHRQRSIMNAMLCLI